MKAEKRIIDAHCHIGKGIHYQLMPAELVAQMDELKVDQAVLVPADRYIAVDNAEGNDLLLDTIKQWPGRFWGFATVNPWYGERAVVELRRALDAGLAGVKLDPILQGFLLCDPLVYPIVEVAIELNVPIYFYTGTPVNALPLQLSELAQIYPEGHFIMGHMGNTDFWIDVPLALAQAPNVWGEISPNLPSAVNRIIDAGLADRLIFGSDAPMMDLELELAKIQYWQATEGQKAAITAGNILNLLERA
jgi:hypothetical protein